MDLNHRPRPYQGLLRCYMHSIMRHRSIAVYLLDENRQRFMGTVGVPDRYRLPKEGEIVEVQYLYCHPGPDGKLIQAKYFGKVRDDIEITECGVSQLKVKANDSD